MEVHSHTHTPRKKWTHYFWEFLMLFLAVFCGFLAEYQLEHVIEKQKEKQYIQSMIEDLQADTANLQKSIASYLLRENNFDTVQNLYRYIATGYNNTLRSNIRKIIGYKDFIPTDKTLQQLKNSGGLRLIRNRKAVDGISLYDSRLKDHDIATADLRDVFGDVDRLLSEIFDNQQLDEDKKVMSIEQLEKTGKKYLLKEDNATLGKFYNRISGYRFLKKLVYTRLVALKQRAIDLMALLKKEYHLK